MIQAKMDHPISITAARKSGVESIIDWFEQHKQSFYMLGWSYLRNQQQMEELFYQSIIKAHKELPRFKSETSFEMWITSIFIHTCRELSDDRSLQVSDESDQHMDLFNALDRLEKDEKEALVLTYVKGVSQKEAAYLLQIPVEKIKENLFSGIQSLKEILGYGSAFIGCKEFHQNYIDYLERTLDRPKKIEFEIHIHHCQDCQEDLAAFQDVMLTMSNLTERVKDLHVPSSFMENVKDRLTEQKKRRQQKNKKRKKTWLVFLSVFALLLGTGFFSGAFTSLYYTWTEKDLELRAFLQRGLGERLNLEAESDGVKIKIRGVIADDVQTLVFYEIENINEKSQYVMNYDDGVFVENKLEIMKPLANQRYYPPDLESNINNEKKNVYHGKISLPPLTTKNGTIKLKITKLQKLFRDSSAQNGYSPNGNVKYARGKWNFKIPVTKQPLIEYALKGKTKIEGIPVRFNKLIIAPTTTILQFDINVGHPEKVIEDLRFDHLDVNNKKVKADKYGVAFLGSMQDVNWITRQAQFDPLFGEKPKRINVQLKSVSLTIADPKTIELDASLKYPQTFEYAGSTISIDKVENGQPAKVVISNHEYKNRAYESLQFNIVNKDQNETNFMGMSDEGVYVDKSGKEYDMNKDPVPYEEIEQPRYFFTVLSMELHSDTLGEKVIPKELDIYGYSATKYLEDTVKIPLK